MYRAFSISSFVGSVLTRIVCFVLIFYLTAHLWENPILISILAFLLLILVLFIGDDQIILSDAELIFTDSSIMIWIFGFGKQKYKIEEVRSVFMQPSIQGAIELGIAAALAVFLPKHINGRTTPLFIELKNGNTVRREISGLSRGQLKKLADAVNSSVGQSPRK
jgi:hypothetical protein